MKLLKLAVSVCAVALLAVGAVAQAKPGNIAGLEFQTPKNGMVKQYGRKTKVYIVGRFAKAQSAYV